ncbi:MAG: hypothetical protein ACP5IC_02550 [Minisyncoccia bacterium]
MFFFFPFFKKKYKFPRIKWKVKPRKVMKDYIALNWLEPELAKKFGIKKREVWVREDWWKDPEKRKRLNVHEKVEINLRLRSKLPYKKAHEIANKFEHNALKHIRGRK